MIGDSLKIGSWILAYLMLGKAMTKAFICSEIIFSATFYLLTVFFVQHMSLKGVAVAHALNYFCYWVVMALFIGRYLYLQKSAGKLQ
jgi:PST family polysaccharide transporter